MTSPLDPISPRRRYGASRLPVATSLVTALAMAYGFGQAQAQEGGDEVRPSMSNEVRNAMGDLACDADNGGLTLPEGICALVVADELGRARHMVVDDEGDIYVVLREARDGTALVALRDADGDGRAETVQRFGDPNHAGTGLAIHDGHLYVGVNDRIVRYPLHEGDFVPSGDPEVIVSGFPDQRSHAAKSIAISDDGSLYVNIGAPSNACQVEDRTAGSPGQDPCPERDRQAGVWRFDAGTPGQDQMADGEHYAAGIRNAVAITWNDRDDHLYVAQHGRDQLHDLWPEYYTAEQGAELPAEELFRVEAGDDFGWPYCYYDPQRQAKVLAPEYGGDGAEVGRCAEMGMPTATYPAHYAPNDILFYDGATLGDRYDGGAFIAFHGSWNRGPFEQQGYNVVFQPLEDDGRAGDWEVFADGFAGKGTIESPSDAAYRPMGLAQGPDGSLYVVDSRQGRLWRIIRHQE